VAKKVAVFLRKKKEFFVWVSQFWNPEQLRHVPVESLYSDEESSCWLVDPALLDTEVTEFKVHLLKHELLPFREKLDAKNIELTAALFEKLFELHVRDTVHEIR